MNNQEANVLDSTVWIPETLDEAWELKQQFGTSSEYVGGGTLLQTKWFKEKNCPPNLISLLKIKDLHGYSTEEINGIVYTRIGALATLDQIKQNHQLLAETPLLEDVIRSIAAPGIRTQATIGGNIATGMGDAIPVLLVLDAHVSLFNGKKHELISLFDYVKGVKFLSNALITSIYLPKSKPSSKEVYFYKKVGHREAFTPSIVTVSGYCRLNSLNEVDHIKLAVSGSRIHPQRLLQSEEALHRKILSSEQLSKAILSLREEFNPESDELSSSFYKKAVVTNIIYSELARHV
ncbi:FAD binding domain-containing protein [Bacillus sp. AK128]